MDLVHYVTVTSAALAAGLPQLEAAFPPSATPWLKGASAICILITGVCAAVSGPITTKSGAAALAARKAP